MADPAAAVDRLVTLRAGGQQLALPAQIVREVARLPRLTRVPHAPSALLGLANIRGTVVPVLSLADLIERPGGGEQRVVLVDDGELVGLAVDAVDRLTHAGDADAVAALDIAALIASSIAPSTARRADGGAIAGEDAAAATEHDTLPLVTFTLGDQEFALPLTAVEEVLRVPGSIARLPHGDAVAIGSVTVRGALLPRLSLRALLAMPVTETTPRSRILVARIGAHRVGLVVDAMRTVERVPESAIDPVPQVLTRGSAEARIQAICRLDGGERLVSVLATDQLLRDDISARLTQTGTRHETGEAAMAAAMGEQFLLFRIGDSTFALPIAAVEKVVPLPDTLARLPKAPPFVKGVMNLRGAVIPVIDQAARFGATGAKGPKRRVVIVRIGDLQAGFAVDSASEVVRIDAAVLQPAPALRTEETRVFDRVADLAGQDRILLIISPRALLDGTEQDLLRGLAITP